MANSTLKAHKLPVAPRGSKRGWPTVSGQVTPETFGRLEQLVLRTGLHRSSLVAEAVEQYLKQRQAA